MRLEDLRKAEGAASDLAALIEEIELANDGFGNYLCPRCRGR